ncbi:MAG: triose-phosphate isomerase [Flavobacteriales bacterium]|jgi:triosephosphate isomerase|nr:triose-phosphate isomerase [Flavobacteriaceae bacterium]RZP05617.1 MAG: triose-phosphate isomerase [Flavobacteriales bacterium]|tara:strand:+ start:213 stop:962 length:750 start_codon:yes stop_codon:yes gene_type:complete
MSREKIVAGNWKMNNDSNQTRSLIGDLIKFNQVDATVMIAPAHTNLSIAQDLLSKSKIEVIAQNMHFSDSGAYTGEVSAQMLKSIGINTVIIGHSERRKYFKETDSELKLKVDMGLSSSMKVIFCIGEEIEDRRNNKHFEVIFNQINNSLFHLKDESWRKIVLAYEPVWAIGTGETASLVQIQEMHSMIRKNIADRYSMELANSISILYGGSVKPENSQDIFSLDDVDGGLIGGASLSANDFNKIISSI